MASFTGTIYLTTNLVNHKIYIGQTSIDRLSYIGSGTAIKKAIKKYGKHNFTRVILRTQIDSLEKLNFWEEYYIQLFNSKNPNIGYNITLGGDNGGWKHTQESLDKIKIRSNQEDNKTRIRQIQKLAAKSLVGKPRTKKDKLNMVSTRFGSIKEIQILTKSGEILHVCNFSSEAAEFTNISKSSIKNNLCGLSKSAGGFIFKYKEIN